MDFTFLGSSGIRISNLCLGTMTFGQQNSEAEGHSQLDAALDAGINFIDTAEMYPVPAREATYGDTERIIGSWLKKSGRRSDVVLASKIAGPNRGLPYIREDMRYTPETIRLSVEKSLSRLQTDYIDLYQLHWPARKMNMFGQLGFVAQEDDWEDNIFEILQTVQKLIDEGKIRAIGLSNEAPWGVMRFLEEAKQNGLPRIQSVQNSYSLLNRTFEIGLAECSLRENVPLLAYSPLAFGRLTGKFRNGQQPAEARLTLFPNFARYNSPEAIAATEAYAEIASGHGLTLTELSLAFIRQQPFVGSTILGATSLAQLEENIKTLSVNLDATVLREIEAVQKRFPNPAP